MRNEFLGIQCNLEWVKPRTWSGSHQGYYIRTADHRFYVSKEFAKGLFMYTAWDKKKIESVYENHPDLLRQDGNHIACMLVHHDNGWLGRYYFLQEAVNICEMRLETMESLTA